MTFTSHLGDIADHLKRALDEPARKSAELIERRAKDRVPVGTGRLRDAIHVDRTGEAEYSVAAGNDHVFYGHVVEHGDSNTPPRPFLVPAFEESRQEALDLAVEALRNLA